MPAVTDSVAANPALASLLPSLASGPAGGMPVVEEHPSGESAGAGFNRLLQELQIPATQGIAPAVGSAATGAASEMEALPAAVPANAESLADAPPAGIPLPPGLQPPSVAEGRRSGRPGGEDAPAGGMDLPLVDEVPEQATAGDTPQDATQAPPLLAPIMPAVSTGTVVAEATPPPAAQPGVATDAASRAARPVVQQAQADPATALGAETAAAAAPPPIPAGQGGMPAATTAAMAKGTRPELSAETPQHQETGVLRLDAVAPSATGIAAAGTATTLTLGAAGSHLPGDVAGLFAEQLPTLQPAGDQEAWSKGLGERLLLMVDKGLQSARLRLHPEHLGPMEIRIHVDEDGATRVLFSAHHGQTREALEQTIPRLHELFAEQGLNLSQANVDAGRRGAFDRQQGGAGAFPGSPPATEPAAEHAPPTMGSSRLLAGMAPGRLDIMA
ncbi:MAG: flagellar hook-length control protein FliK [Gammaproteobacteria bacterium]|nr:flagellar hook-length control protein FliK [Gammaproteobacteria bacterium]